MKQFKFSLFGLAVLAAVFYAEQAVAMSIAVQPAIFQLSQVTDPVPKDDDQQEPDEGDECDLPFPHCEVHLEKDLNLTVSQPITKNR